MIKLQNAKLNNTFTNELPADSETKNFTRQVYDACFSWVAPKETAEPKVLICSKELAAELGISDVDSESFQQIVTGNELIENSKPYAMCYGGHQFGNWASQLGDGRAINLGQLEYNNKSWMLQLKGAGATPYSRNADGLAVLRSSVREFLCSEAMFYLGVATTRALSLSLTGDKVIRDVLYDGNAAYEPGAIVCRVSPAFIRFGSFQLLNARKDYETLKKLTDYTIKYHYPHLGTPNKETYIKFFNEVAVRTADMIVNWQRVGFVHGVMNTDNMSILGETIDYGPYGWLENFDQEWTPNTTDAQHRRYQFGNQGSIALWNLTQLANALYPLVEDVPALEQVLSNFKDYYISNYAKMLYAKLGLEKAETSDQFFQNKLFKLLTKSEVDMTIFYRNLTAFDIDNVEAHFKAIKDSSYLAGEMFNSFKDNWMDWLTEYAEKLKEENQNQTARITKMNTVNPKYVLRNYMAQLAIEDAKKGKYELLHELHELLKNPYDEQKDKEKWFAKRPDWALNKVGCSQLSCSS